MFVEKVENSNLNSFKFLLGNLYWLKKSGKKILLSKEGTVLDMELTQKLITKGESLSVEISVQKICAEKVFEYLSLLENAKFENERVVARLEFVKIFNKDFTFSGEEVPNALNQISYACFTKLLNLTSELEELFLSNNLEIFERNIKIASVCTFSAILLGYLKYEFLQSYFNTILLTDIHLAMAHYSASYRNLFDEEIDQSEEKSVQFLKEEKNKDFWAMLLKVRQFKKENITNELHYLYASVKELFDNSVDLNIENIKLKSLIDKALSDKMSNKVKVG